MSKNSTEIDDALELAIKVHRGKTDRAKLPYMYHIFEVLKKVRDKGYGRTYQVVAILHDTVEDNVPEKSGYSRDDLLEIIRMNHGQAILNAVEAITKLDAEDYLEEYIPSVANNPYARVVKLADLEHNLDLSRIPEPLIEADWNRVRKYRKAQKRLEAAR